MPPNFGQFKERVLELNRVQLEAALQAVRAALLRHVVDPRTGYPTHRFEAPYSHVYDCDYCSRSARQTVQYCGQCLFDQCAAPAVRDSFRLV